MAAPRARLLAGTLELVPEAWRALWAALLERLA